MTPYALSINKSIFIQLRKTISIVILAAFISTSVKSPAYAQASSMPFMPKPGVMVHLSPEYTPAYLKGIVIHPENALKFDFIVNKGDKVLTNAQKIEEYTKLTKYFLASLAIPDDDQWVNLSPYEKNRIIKDDFGKTEMGRDLLAQDYMLKQITASLIYPGDNLGRKFWDRIYAQAQQQYGTSNIPVNTFNKVWIIPDDALIYEKGNTAYILKNHLKVMLEEDYLSLQKHSGISAPVDNKTHTIASKIVKEIILPELEREVNEGKNFASLRQVYSGMLLAAWYKRALKESLLGKIYANQSKVKGVDQDPKANEAIYQQYLKAFKKGVFNFIKEDVDKYTNETIPRKYFSGGEVGFGNTVGTGTVYDRVVHQENAMTSAQREQVLNDAGRADDFVVLMKERREFAQQIQAPKEAAMSAKKINVIQWLAVAGIAGTVLVVGHFKNQFYQWPKVTLSLPSIVQSATTQQKAEMSIDPKTSPENLIALVQEANENLRNINKKYDMEELYQPEGSYITLAPLDTHESKLRLMMFYDNNILLKKDILENSSSTFYMFALAMDNDSGATKYGPSLFADGPFLMTHTTFGRFMLQSYEKQGSRGWTVSDDVLSLLKNNEAALRADAEVRIIMNTEPTGDASEDIRRGIEEVSKISAEKKINEAMMTRADFLKTAAVLLGTGALVGSGALYLNNLRRETNVAETIARIMEASRRITTFPELFTAFNVSDRTPRDYVSYARSLGQSLRWGMAVQTAVIASDVKAQQARDLLNQVKSDKTLAPLADAYVYEVLFAAPSIGSLRQLSKTDSGGGFFAAEALDKIGENNAKILAKIDETIQSGIAQHAREKDFKSALQQIYNSNEMSSVMHNDYARTLLAFYLAKYSFVRSLIDFGAREQDIDQGLEYVYFDWVSRHNILASQNNEAGPVPVYLPVQGNSPEDVYRKVSASMARFLTDAAMVQLEDKGIFSKKQIALFGLMATLVAGTAADAWYSNASLPRASHFIEHPQTSQEYIKGAQQALDFLHPYMSEFNIPDLYEYKLVVQLKGKLGIYWFSDQKMAQITEAFLYLKGMARDPKAPATVVDQLVNFDDNATHQNIANLAKSNPNLSPKIVEKLVNDGDISVSTNPVLTADQIRRLYKTNPQSADYLTIHQNLPEDMREVFVHLENIPPAQTSTNGLHFVGNNFVPLMNVAHRADLTETDIAKLEKTPMLRGELTFSPVLPYAKLVQYLIEGADSYASDGGYFAANSPMIHDNPIGTFLLDSYNKYQLISTNTAPSSETMSKLKDNDKAIKDWLKQNSSIKKFNLEPTGDMNKDIEILLKTVLGNQTKEEANEVPDIKGGIDFNAAHLNLQIKRDGKGVPLPISQQNLENIHIDGLIPVILDIKPAMSSPLFSQLQVSGSQEQAKI
jgi:hypothetical protein